MREIAAGSLFLALLVCPFAAVYKASTNPDVAAVYVLIFITILCIMILGTEEKQ